MDPAFPTFPICLYEFENSTTLGPKYVVRTADITQRRCVPFFQANSMSIGYLVLNDCWSEQIVGSDTAAQAVGILPLVNLSVGTFSILVRY